MSNSLLKNIGRNSIADGLYKQVTTRSTRFYHTFGKTANLTEPTSAPVVDSRKYERTARNEIIAMKEISPSDISYVIPRLDWTSGVIYDNYDDAYSSEITGLNLKAGGTGYTSPVITIGDECPTTTSVTLNAQYYVTNTIGYLYTVTTAGITGSSNSVLGTTIGTTYTHGTAVLTCVGYQATATASLGIGALATVIVSVKMTYSGFGYISSPIVYITGGSGYNADISAVITIGKTGASILENTRYYVHNTNEGNIYICIDNNNGAASTISPSGISNYIFSTADGYQWKYMSSIPLNNKFLTTNYLPVYTASKDQYNATGSIVSVIIDNPGVGYTSSTTITVLGDGINAILTPTIDVNGSITGIIITNAGSGYSYANINISSEGTGASISVSLFTGPQSNSIQAYNENSVISGCIISAQIVSGGYGYTYANISFKGDGSGAIASAVITNGKISKIDFTSVGLSRGKDYNWADVIIDGDGYGALIRTVISPFGGLGKDPINQLCAKSLMFYSKINNNTHHGINIANDYKQIAIIKDPLRYNNGLFLKSSFASTCWKVAATSSISSSFTIDSIITTYSNSTPYTFRIVYVSESTILLIPIDNGIPVAGMQFTTNDGVSFIASSAIPPNVDKYSGDLMLIDNEAAFIGNSVVVRTIINL